MERLPTEAAIVEQTRRFKGILRRQQAERIDAN
jgi:hypothetical protein